MIRGQQKIEGRPSTILLIQLGDIGDVVLTTPCLRALRQAYPTAHLCVAVRDKAAELLEDSPWLDDVFVVGKGRSLLESCRNQYGFFRRLREKRFDLVLDLRTGTRGALMAFLSGAPQRISFYSLDGPWWRNKIFSGLLCREYAPTEYVADYLLGLLDAFGISLAGNEPALKVSDSRTKEARRLLTSEGIALDRPLIAVQPFSLWRYKDWGAAKFIALIKWLINEYGVDVVVAGSSDEGKRAEEIVRKCGDACHNLAGKTSIAFYAALLQQCHLFVGVDSAGVHIAAAVNTPTISFFGPSSPISWAPRGEKHLVVQKKYECVPCRRKGCGGMEQSRCLEELSFQEVKTEIKKFIEIVKLK